MLTYGEKMKNRIIEDNGENLDELVKRARKDSELKRIMRGEIPAKQFSYIHDLICETRFNENVVDFDWGPDGDYMIVATEKKVHIRHLATNRDKRVDAVRVDTIAFSPKRVVKNESHYYAVYGRKNVLVLKIFADNDFEMIQSTKLFPEYANEIYSAAFSSDGNYLVVCTDWGQEVFHLGYQGNWVAHQKLNKIQWPGPRKVAFDKRTGYFGFADENKIFYYNKDLSATRDPDEFPADVIDLSFGCDDAVAFKDYVALSHNKIEHKGVSGIAFNNRGDKLAVSAGREIFVYKIKDEK
jgi:WD40 repeat protein